MSSDPTMDTGAWSRCLFCSLQCHLGIRDAGSGVLEPVFPPEGGLCARGQCVGELASTVRRGTVRDSRHGSNEELTFSEGLARAADMLREASGVDIVVDGNHKAELLAVAARVASEHASRARGLVALPSEDLLLLQQAWASGARVGDLSSLGSADGLVVIGDPFSSNPRSARPILEFKRRNRRAPLVVIDSTARRTALFATHPVVVPPQAIPAAVSCIIPKDVAAFTRTKPSEIDPAGSLERACRALERCSRIGVVIAATPGRGSNWASAAYSAGLLARSQGTDMVVLTQYGNACSAARFVASGMLLPVGHLGEQAPDGRVVVVLGEYELCLPTPDTADYVAGASGVIHVGFHHSPDSQGLHFPGLVFAEDDGSVVTADATWVRVPAAIPPPAGILTTEGTFRTLAVAAGLLEEREISPLPVHPEFVTPQSSASSMPVGGAGAFTGILASDPEQFVDGQLTGATSLFRDRRPTVVVAVADSTRVGLADGAEVLLTSENGQCAASVKVCPHQPPGFVAVSATNGDVKGLFSWEMCAGLPVALPSRLDIDFARNET